MATTKHNIVIQQGANFALNVTAKNDDGSIKDLTGYTAKMQVRITPTDNTILLEASSANGRITINAPGGIVMVAVGADVTTGLNWNVAYYDIEITTGATNVFRIVEGFATFSREVTK